MNYYSHTCKCGCGGKIQVKKSHRYDRIPEYIKGHNKSQLGKKRTEEQRQTLSNSLKGRRTWNKGLKGVMKAWNKGLTKENNESMKIISDKKKGYKITEKNRENLVDSHLAFYKNGGKVWNDGVRGCFSEESRLQISNTVSLLWKTEEYNKKQKEARNLFPNKAELKLQNIINTITNSFLYVGDFNFFIGGKCPDFIDKTNNKIIELYGDYWHKGQDTNDRINYFKNYGYDTLVIWESELKDKRILKIKINEFLGGI